MQRAGSKGGRPQRASLIVVILILKVMIECSEGAVYPRCPLEGNYSASSFCNCTKGTEKSGVKVTIRCSFGDTEDVVLTEDLYPFESSNLMFAQVIVQNAASVKVTAGFLEILQAVPSVALNVWRGGDVTLESSPPMRRSLPPTFSTSLALRFINCSISRIPSNLLRDKSVGELLIRASKVESVSQGFINNVGKIKYLWIENSVVGSVEGPISGSRSLPLAPEASKWHGFKICNSTVREIASGAFSFTSEGSGRDSGLCESRLMYSQFETLGTNAIAVVGQLDITIRGNTFGLVEKDAIKVDVTGYLKFEDNLVEQLKPGGLEGMLCAPGAIMERNTVHLETPLDVPRNSTNKPFNAACGNPQVFIVVSPPQPRTEERTSKATWVLLGVIVVFVVGLSSLGFYLYRNQAFHREYRRGLTNYRFGDLSERTTMQELCNNHEADAEEGEEAENEETGMCNPGYDIKEPS